jgi:hypothetical protein
MHYEARRWRRGIHTFVERGWQRARCRHKGRIATGMAYNPVIESDSSIERHLDPHVDQLYT